MILKKIFRKIRVVLLIVGLGYGCILLNDAQKSRQKKVDDAFAEAYETVISELSKEAPEAAVVIGQGAAMGAMYAQSSYRNGEETDLTAVVDWLSEQSADPASLVLSAETLAALEQLFRSDFSAKQATAALNALRAAR